MYCVVLLVLLFVASISGSAVDTFQVNLSNKLQLKWSVSSYNMNISLPGNNGSLFEVDQDVVAVNVTLQLLGEGWVGFGFADEQIAHNKPRLAVGSALESAVEFYSSNAPPVSDLSSIVPWTKAARFTHEGGVSMLNVEFASNLEDARNATLMVAHGDNSIVGYHGNENRFLLSANFMNGTSSLGDSMTMDYRVIAHVLCMTGAFAVFLPMAVISAAARPLNGSNHWRFRHKLFSFIAVAAAGSGVGIIVWYVEEWDASYHISTPHHFAGVAVVGLLLINPIVGALKPDWIRGDEKTTNLKVWQFVHRGLGFLAFGGGLANMAWGAFDTLPRHFPAKSVVMFQWKIPVSLATIVTLGASGGLLVLVVLVAVIHHCRKKRVKRLMEKSQVSMTRYSHFTLRNNRAKKSRKLKLSRTPSHPASMNSLEIAGTAPGGAVVTGGEQTEKIEV